MAENDCLECKLTQICKIYKSFCNLCDEINEHAINQIDDTKLCKLVAYNCDYYEHKDK